MNTGIDKLNTDSGIDRLKIYSWLRHAGLLALTAASAVYFISACISYCSSFGSPSDTNPRTKLVSSDASMNQRLDREKTLSNDEALEKASRIDDEIRYFVRDKKARFNQRVPGGEVFENTRELRIRELKSQLEGFTEYPEGSMQWHRLNRLQQLESNIDH